MILMSRNSINLLSHDEITTAAKQIHFFMFIEGYTFCNYIAKIPNVKDHGAMTFIGVNDLGLRTTSCGVFLYSTQTLI